MNWEALQDSGIRPCGVHLPVFYHNQRSPKERHAVATAVWAHWAFWKIRVSHVTLREIYFNFKSKYTVAR